MNRLFLWHLSFLRTESSINVIIIFSPLILVHWNQREHVEKLKRLGEKNRRCIVESNIFIPGIKTIYLIVTGPSPGASTSCPLAAWPLVPDRRWQAVLLSPWKAEGIILSARDQPERKQPSLRSPSPGSAAGLARRGLGRRWEDRGWARKVGSGLWRRSPAPRRRVI